MVMGSEGGSTRTVGVQAATSAAAVTQAPASISFFMVMSCCVAPLYPSRSALQAFFQAVDHLVGQAQGLEKIEEVFLDVDVEVHRPPVELIRVAAGEPEPQHQIAASGEIRPRRQAVVVEIAQQPQRHV